LNSDFDKSELLIQPEGAGVIPFIPFVAHNGETLDGGTAFGFRVGNGPQQKCGGYALPAIFRGTKKSK
jgi:hypothetical protein